MKKFMLILFFIILPFSVYSVSIKFSGSNSRLSLQENKKIITLTGDANVSIDSLNIKADSISLEGESYEKISSSGKIEVSDEEKGLFIRCNSLSYNKDSEILFIKGYHELSDDKNEIQVSANSLEYDMREEKLTLMMNVHLLKASGNDILSCKAEQIEYNRRTNFLNIFGSATLSFRGNVYQAKAITVDLDNEEISLEGRIKGSIDG